jgi:hypothetical protein
LQGPKDLDFVDVVIDADDLMADFGKASASDQPYVTGANDCQFHFAAFVPAGAVGTGATGAALGAAAGALGAILVTFMALVPVRGGKLVIVTMRLVEGRLVITIWGMVGGAAETRFVPSAG